MLRLDKVSFTSGNLKKILSKHNIRRQYISCFNAIAFVSLQNPYNRGREPLLKAKAQHSLPPS
jgi:hypothetical protein